MGDEVTMRQIIVRTVLLFLGLALLSVLDNAGWLEPLLSHPVGLALYWLYLVALFAFLIFGIARPVHAHFRSHR